LRIRSQFWTAPNQITLLRLLFVPFVMMNVLDGHYGWALGLFVAAGISDALDGTLARWLKQRTVLGEYLDPIADKLLLSTLFLTLSFVHQIPWRYTVLVFSRDLSIVAIAGVLYVTVGIRDFRPSVFGKMNTFAQISAVFFVLLAQVTDDNWIRVARKSFLYATFAFTIVSAVHYIFLVGQRIHAASEVRSASQQ
jgi:cardiolipin synthase (CMP-forming)